jgi:phage-related protein
LVVATIGLIGLAAYEIIKHWETVKEFFSDFWGGIESGFKSFVNIIIDGVNWIIQGLNKLQVEIPEWVPEVGGQKWGINIEEIPHLANGGYLTMAGSVLVGERGPEVLSLPAGAQVTPLDKLNQVIQHTGTITVKGINDKGQLMGVVDLLVSDKGSLTKLERGLKNVRYGEAARGAV